MSRELLKRAMRALNNTIEAWDRDAIHGKAASELIYGGDLIGLAREIEVYLAQPEEPVAWLIPGSITRDKQLAEVNGRNAISLYTEQPDQSARVANLETELKRICDIHTEAMSKYHDLQQQLAALQAKREPLSVDEIMQSCNAIGSSSLIVKIARAIEAAHGITGGE